MEDAVVDRGNETDGPVLDEDDEADRTVVVLDEETRAVDRVNDVDGSVAEVDAGQA